MRSPLVVTYIIAALAFLGMQSAEAASKRFSTRISGDLDALQKLVATPARTNDRFKVIHLAVDGVYGVGRVNVAITKRKVPPAEAVLVQRGVPVKDGVVPTLLQGKAYLNRSSGSANVVRVSISVIKNTLSLQFLAKRGTSGARRARLFTLRAALSRTGNLKARTFSKSNSVFAAKVCSTVSKARTSDSTTTLFTKRQLETFRLITISTDADPEWYAKYGDRSNAEVAAIINTAEVVYQDQLGLRFAIVRQHVYTDTSPYTDLDPSALLTSFKKNPENPANLGFNPLTFNDDVDAKYLFTGKDLLGGTVGLSYVGAMCWSPKDAYGLIQDVSRDINISAFLHEMGHTLGAQHELTDPTGVMYPDLGVDRRHFASASIEQINRHFSFFGKCVSEELLKPSVMSSKLVLKRSFSKDKKLVILKGSAVSAAGIPLSDQVIEITLNKKKVVQVTTDQQGLFRYSIKKTRYRSVGTLLVEAKVEQDEVSTPITLKIPLRA